jgi:uncharacterized protein DUF3303
MKILSTYAIRPGCLKEAANRFLTGKGMQVEGAKLIGRWHRSDASGGVAVYEVENPAAFSRNALEWSDVLEVTHTPVLDDAEAGASLASVFAQ